MSAWMPDGGYTPPGTSQADAIIRLVGWIMGAVGLGGYLFWAANGGLVREGNWVGVDFRVYYQAAQVLSRGGDIYSAGISPPYVYPPFLAIVVVPLTALSQTGATIVWKLLQHICLIAAGWLLIRLVPPRIRPLAGGLLLLGWLTVPLQDEIRVGESNSLILLLLAGTVWLVAHGEEEKVQGPDGRTWDWGLGTITSRAAVAGSLLALAMSIKVLPVLVVGYFWWRGPRAVAAVATGGFLVLQVLSFLITPATVRYWFVEFPGLFGQAFPYPDNQSLNALLARALMPSDEYGLAPMQLAEGEAARPVLTWIVNGLVLAGAILVLWVSRRRGKLSNGLTPSHLRVYLLLEVGLVLLTTHLVSGSTWLHHLVLMSVPIMGLLGVWWLAREAATGRGDLSVGTTPLALVLGACLALLLHRPYDWAFIAAEVAPGNALLALLASSMATWVVLGMWIAVAVTLLKRNA